MTNLEEGLKVWVRQSKCGYQGPAILVGLCFGSNWLAKVEADQKIILVKAEFVEPYVDKSQIPDGLPKEEKKAQKRKQKAERKNRLSRGDGGRRR